jgi:hypothetical protein
MTDYYRGIVTSIIASEGMFDVDFDDGTASADLALDCLRSFQPYQIGEEVEVRLNEEEEEWIYGTILRITHSDGGNTLCDINIEEEEDVVTMVQSGNIRRMVVHSFDIGDRILALYNDNDDDKWYPGEIEGVNEDGTFVVRYFDDDVEYDVPEFRVRSQLEA